MVRKQEQRRLKEELQEFRDELRETQKALNEQRKEQEKVRRKLEITARKIQQQKEQEHKLQEQAKQRERKLREQYQRKVQKDQQRLRKQFEKIIEKEHKKHEREVSKLKKIERVETEKLIKHHQRQLKKETTKWEHEIRKELEQRSEFSKWRGSQKTRKTRQVLENKLGKIFKRVKKYIDEQPQAVLLEQAHNGDVKTYVIKNTRVTDEITFLERSKDEVLRIGKENVMSKISLKLRCDFEHYNAQTGMVDEVKNEFFSSKQYANITSDSMRSAWETISNRFREMIANYVKNGSGWRIKRITELHIHVSRYNPIGGSGWIPLPKDLAEKQAVLNMKNNDNKCFKYAVTRSLNPVEKNGERVSKLLRKQMEELCWDGIHFPTKVSEFSKFEQNNPEKRLMVYAYADKKQFWEKDVICPLWISQKTEGVKIPLFLYKGHFIPITSMSRLLNAQVDTNGNKAEICDRCLKVCYSPTALENHERYCRNHDFVREVYPEKGENDVSFKNWQNTQKHPIAIFADFECAPTPVDIKKGEKTHQFQKHKPTGFGLLVQRYDDKNEYISHTGEDAPSVFTKTLEKITKDWYFETKDPIPLITDENIERSYHVATHCYVCNKKLEDTNDKSRIRVRDHCHLTGKFRGIAHSGCNLHIRVPTFIPVFLHNLCGYDERLFLRELGESVGDIGCIAKNEENFISFGKSILMETVTKKGKKDKSDKKIDIHREIRFLDSMKFMNTSLGKLVENLDDSKFYNLEREFPDKNQRKLLLRKGVYPYSYVDSQDKLCETQLPPMQAFYNDLSKEHISKVDYEHAVKVWYAFGCKTMQDYHDLYLKVDVLQLADVFTEFRNMSLKNYNLDPVYYYTAPGLSWDAALKNTKVTLELFKEEQEEMFLMVEAGIRGGVSMISHRHSTANNKHMKNYKPKELQKFITYLDANNLYGWAMMKPLPTGGFKWMSPEDLTNWRKISGAKNRGCILEVDLEYPEHLQDKHSDFPLAPEGHVVNGIQKLVPNLMNKERYVIHHEALKCYLRHGLKISKIHKGISFDESPWLAPYIEMNTKLRAKAANDFEKDLFKLMNNSVFGKTMENIRNRVNIQVATNDNYWKQVRSVIQKSYKT